MLATPKAAASSDGPAEGAAEAEGSVETSGVVVRFEVFDPTPDAARLSNTCWPSRQRFPEVNETDRQMGVEGVVSQTSAGSNAAEAKLLLMPDTPLDLTLTMTLPETLNPSDLNGGTLW